jgi:hypothetical protein
MLLVPVNAPLDLFLIECCLWGITSRDTSRKTDEFLQAVLSDRCGLPLSRGCVTTGQWSSGRDAYVNPPSFACLPAP